MREIPVSTRRCFKFVTTLQQDRIWFRWDDLIGITQNHSILTPGSVTDSYRPYAFKTIAMHFGWCSQDR